MFIRVVKCVYYGLAKEKPLESATTVEKKKA